ncbi:DUF6795 domain-containing protein [Limnobacter sp.]|uniref:DUF6795 domain-containing protein n=1 Tax=Limnobacter sp. TaxID=2003368 RepID=UPI0037480BB0
MHRILLALVLLLPLAPLPTEAFVFKKIVYCSPIEGLIHWQGKPLANVIATRELYSGGFEGGKFTDTATTDSEGRFKFEVVQERRFLRPDLLSANPRVSQFLIVKHQSFDYLVWTFDKLDSNFGTESAGSVLTLDCDLSSAKEESDLRIVRCKNNGIRKL